MPLTSRACHSSFGRLPPQHTHTSNVPSIQEFMWTISTPSASVAFRPRRSMHSRPMLSSEIVRPVFKRLGKEDIIDSDGYHIEAPKPLGKRIFSHPMPSSAVLAPPVAEEKYQPNPRMASSYSVTSSAFDTAMVYHPASGHSRKSESEQSDSKPKRTRLTTERRREQCRANQARYRQRQFNHVKTIRHAVQKLRADIPVLELQRNRLQYGGQLNVWDVVVEYFRNFRFGVPITLSESLGEEETRTTINLPEYADNAVAKHQLAFLRSCMSEDVILLGDHCGVEALMQQWQAYSLSFKNLHFELRRMERTSDRFVHAAAKLTVTVSEATFKNLFPEMNSASLRSRLLGHRLELPCTLCFEWNKFVGRVSRLETTVNFMTPLVKALGDLSDVAMVLERARITSDGAVAIREAEERA